MKKRSGIHRTEVIDREKNKLKYARRKERKRELEIFAHLAQVEAYKAIQAGCPLTPAQIKKIEKFGKRAIVRTPKQAKALAIANGRIAWEREQRALKQFKPDDRMLEWLDENIGFKPGSTSMSAAHKGLRVHAAFLMAKKFRRFFRENAGRLQFHFVTIIHDGWRTTDRQALINLVDIKERVRNLFHPYPSLHHIGVIELDALNNYPGKGDGLMIIPHAHLMVWSKDKIEPEALSAMIAGASRLTSEWGADPVVSLPVTEENVVHLSQYMFEQAYKCKRLGKAHAGTGVRKLRTLTRKVPPHLTLRLSEILAHCTLKELIISKGQGLELKGALVKALSEFQRQAGLGKISENGTAEQVFAALRDATTKGKKRGPVSIRRTREAKVTEGFGRFQF